jgi:hypothetical protein
MTQALRLATSILAAVVALLILVSLLVDQNSSAERIELLTKVVTSAGLFVGALWAIVTYSHNKKQEFQKAFNDREVDTFAIAAMTVGDLVGSCNSKEWDKARARFWELYWGRLVLFEDARIVEMMVALGQQLDKASFENRRMLDGQVYQVSLALRDFLKEKNARDWQITFAYVNESTKQGTAVKREVKHRRETKLEEGGKQ